MTTTPPLLSGLDGLMSLSRREGVDIRPTLLRVLTDIYVQAPTHTGDEEQQFVELASRLIEQVDDATRAAVRARLAIYAQTPAAIAEQLEIRSRHRGAPAPPALPATPSRPEPDRATEPVAAASAPSNAPLPMLPNDAARISEMFFAAGSGQRAAILFHLADAPLKTATHVPTARAERAVQILERAAFAADVETFTHELADALILPARIAARVVDDGGGEPLACALKALGVSSAVFQRVLLFLNPEVGASVATVYRLSRLYDRISERAALILLAAWHGAVMPAARAKYQPLLHDDERNRPRALAPQPRVEVQQKNHDASARTNLRHDKEN
ncbi:MAG: DUF2336 domain-containing protein [Xanthobacteraceae bacterium]|nr:DUF2336 domain-containing protein [Xanthobacteraceae bacterium]